MLPCIVYHGLKLGAKSSIKIMSIKPYSLKKVGKYWHYDFRVNGERYRGSTKAVSKELAVRYIDNYYLELYEAGSNLSNEKKDIKSFIVEHVQQGLHSLSPDWLYTKERTLEKFRDFLHGMRVYELSESGWNTWRHSSSWRSTVASGGDSLFTWSFPKSIKTFIKNLSLIQSKANTSCYSLFAAISQYFSSIPCDIHDNLKRFSDSCLRPDFEFLDTDIESLRATLSGYIDKFLDNIAQFTYTLDANHDKQRVSKEWSYGSEEKKKRRVEYVKTLNDLSKKSMINTTNLLG